MKGKRSSLRGLTDSWRCKERGEDAECRPDLPVMLGLGFAFG
jgi:hypothetical protein